MNVIYGVESQNILELRQYVESKDVYLSFKRIFDLTFSFFLLLLLLPLLMVTFFIIKLSSKGPAIFKQSRIGLNGEEFTIYKFRTMYYAEHNDLFKFVSDDERKKGYYDKTKKDPRITPIGKFLRKSSIDELPQLFNVLFGDMSLVGPRPTMRYFLESYPNIMYLRTVVKPGITGLWQVKNRANSTTILDMVDYDTEYINNANFLLDLKILLLTIPAVLKAEGAL